MQDSSNMSHIMTKPAFAICKQQRHRSACTSAQSISAFVVRCLDRIIPLVSISEISSLYLAHLAAQAGLCLTSSQTLKTGFLVMRLLWQMCSPSWPFFVSHCWKNSINDFQRTPSLIQELLFRVHVSTLICHKISFCSRIQRYYDTWLCHLYCVI